MTLPLAAFRLLVGHAKLLIWAVFPILLTIGVYWVVVVRVNVWAKLALVAYLASLGWDPGGWGVWIGLQLVKVLLFLVSALTFSLVATIVSSPFNDWLAENVERVCVPKLDPAPKTSAGGQLRLLVIDLVKSVSATVAGVSAIVLSWFPGVNVVAFVILCLLMAFQYVSYPQTRRGIGFREGFRFVWTHKYAAGGFGAVITFLFSLPLLSSLALPLAVVGGTLLFARASRPASREWPRLR